MPSVYDLKSRFQQLLSPLAGGLHARNITANQVTISALVLSFLIGIAFWYAGSNTLLYLALPIGLFIRMALNAIDGMIARQYDQQTKLGEVLNELGDVVSDVAIYFPVIKYVQEFPFVATLFLILCPINEFAGFMGKVVGKGRRYDGPMGKSDRALVFGLFGLLSFFGLQLGGYLHWILTAMISLILLSTFVRIWKALKA